MGISDRFTCNGVIGPEMLLRELGEYENKQNKRGFSANNTALRPCKRNIKGTSNNSFWRASESFRFWTASEKTGLSFG